MPQGLKDLIADAASRVQTASVQDVKEQQDRGEVDFLLDVRDRHEFDTAHVQGATNISRGLLEIRAAADSPSANETLASNNDARIVTYCTKAPGLRSLMAADTLTKLGYTNVVAMEGGLNAWADAGFAVDEA